MARRKPPTAQPDRKFTLWEFLQPQLDGSLSWAQMTEGLPPIPPSADGNPSEWERILLLRAARHVGATTAFEFGTFDGVTAKLLAELSDMETVWTLDLPEGTEPSLPVALGDEQWLGRAKVPLHPKVVQLWGDSAEFDFSPYRSECDLVYVHGAHSPEYIENDASRARELVSEHGVIFLHAGAAGNLEAVRTLLAGWKPVGNRMAMWEKND